MLPMTAAVNVDPRASSDPQGGAAAADPRTALRGAAPLAPQAGVAPQGVTASVIPEAALSLPRRAFAKNEHLYRQGESATQAFILEAGLVALTLDALHDRDRVVALAGPGDVIGALTPSLPAYQDGAVALSGEVSVRLLPVTDQAAGGARPRELAALLDAAVGEQIVRLTRALEDSAHPVPARVANALLRLGERFGQRMDDGAVRLTLPVTHETLAAMVGAARETTTSIVQQLRRAGLIEGTRGSYRFVPSELSAYASEAVLASR